MNKRGLLNVAICIPVYNEAKNVSHLLNSLLNQKLKNVNIDEIIIISSGSTDKTHVIARSYAKNNKKIKIVREKMRRGKASAVNLFIEKTKNDILVLTNGDIILTEDVIEKLVLPFNDHEIGMTGAHPIPLNTSEGGFFSFAGELLWELHHQVSLKFPKMGELIAFRKIFKRIPVLSSVDEANIEPLIRGQGYRIQYVSEAKIYNKAPTTIKDFIQQRRRIYSGHLAVKYEQSYEVSTLHGMKILQALFVFLTKHPRPIFFLYTPFVVFLEVVSRFLGWWDYTFARKRYTVWKTIESTKDLYQKT